MGERERLGNPAKYLVVPGHCIQQIYRFQTGNVRDFATAEGHRLEYYSRSGSRKRCLETLRLVFLRVHVARGVTQDCIVRGRVPPLPNIFGYWISSTDSDAGDCALTGASDEAGPAQRVTPSIALCAERATPSASRHHAVTPSASRRYLETSKTRSHRVSRSAGDF